MNTRIKFLILALAVTVPLVALRSQPAGPSRSSVSIRPASVVTIPEGEYGITSPGGDTVWADRGDVVVSTDVNNAFTSIVVPAGATADVDISTGAAKFVLVGGGSSSAVIDGHGLTLDVDMPGGNVVLTGAGNTVVDSNSSTAPTRYEATWGAPASNHLQLNGHTGIRTVGPWFVDP